MVGVGKQHGTVAVGRPRHRRGRQQRQATVFGCFGRHRQRLLGGERADAVDESPASAQQADPGVEQGALQSGQSRHRRTLHAPAGVGAPAQSAQAAAGCVHQHRIAAARTKGRMSSVGRHHMHGPGVQSLAVGLHQSDSTPMGVSRDHPSATGGQRGGLAARRSAHVGYQVAGLHLRGVHHQLGTPVLDVAVSTAVHRGRSVHRLQRGQSRFGAEVCDERLDDPVRIAEPGGVVGPVRCACVGQPTQHGVDQSTVAAGRHGHGGRHRGVSRGVQLNDLVGA